MVTELLRTPLSRVFLIEDGAGPGNTPEYQGFARATGISFPQGDITPITQASADAYDRFDVIDRIKSQPDLPSLNIEARRQMTLSALLRLARKGCAFDVQIHWGRCQNPQDFDGGWDLIDVLEGAESSDYSTGDLGALDADQNATVEETLAIAGLNLYQLKKLLPAEVCSTEVDAEVVDVVICDRVQCGECGIASDGCSVVFSLTSESAASPGLGVEIIFTRDGYATCGRTLVTTLAAGEAANAMACVGQNLIVVSEDSESLHFAAILDILDGAETWAEVTTGFAVGGGPRAIFSPAATATFIVGAGGHIYFATDPTSEVTVQSAGAITAEDLNAIHGISRLNAVIVGNNNVVLVTENGGTTYSLVTGPAPGVNLTTVWQRSLTEWIVGTADGRLFFTRDSGQTWTAKAFPGSGSGVVRDISFSTANVGYLAHDTTAPAGRILRTINGGFSWLVEPITPGILIPANQRISSVVGCTDDPNVVYGGGLAAAGVDGILLKFA